MDAFNYSWKALGAFAAFLAIFGLMVALLWWLDKLGATCYINLPEKADLFSLLTTLPFVAFYLVVLIGATAGYARSAIVADTLPISKMFDAELSKRTMNSASIKTKVRSGGQIKADDTFSRAMDNLISSRVPILAVVDDDNKVTGVVTGVDIMKMLQTELDKTDGTPLTDRLENILVKDLQPRPPVVAATSDNLRQVAFKMIVNQFTKLIVVQDASSMKFAGTVDMLDLVSEIFDGDEEKKNQN
ncbi:MAG: CBS domain-containing protein [Acidobacteriota bacterium]